MAARHGSYLSFSCAGGTRLEVRSASSGPHLPVALPDGVGDGLRPDFHPLFEDVATQLPRGASLQSDLTFTPQRQNGTMELPSIQPAGIYCTQMHRLLGRACVVLQETELGKCGLLTGNSWLPLESAGSG